VTTTTNKSIGAPLDRIDGSVKVRGVARYAFEQPVDRAAYLYPLLATVARGRITGVDTRAATAEQGVVAVLTRANAPKLASTENGELAILQSDEVAFRGQMVGGVIAETPEIARFAAGLIRFDYEEQPHDVELRADRADLYDLTESANRFMPPPPAKGNIDRALESATVSLDATYTTAMYHHNPMEPHSTIATWTDDGLTIYCSSQGVHRTRAIVAGAFGLDPRRVRVISPHVGGGFGSKVNPRADVILAAMAAQLVAGRPVKLALTRQQMFSQVGYRSPTIQRIRLAADADGRLTAVVHDAVEQTAKILEFAENSSRSTRTMYAAANQRTTQRLAALDVPAPTIMRAPGECPGMFALESAIDEMAIACGLDPVEFRIRNEPDVDPGSGLPFSSRHLVACLREGARRFGWDPDDRTPRARRDRGWLVGSGVAASVYPMFRLTGNAATIRVGADRRYTVSIGAADLGTGTWTTLTQIAADALGVTVEQVELRIGDSDLPMAAPAGGSTGINSWGSTIVAAAHELRARLASDRVVPAEGVEVTVEMPDNPDIGKFSMYAYGAQFAEVRVDEETGEVRVPRLLGVFDTGQIINAKTARSQLLGGMTMGLSMALHEGSVVHARFGHVVTQDFVAHRIATNADVGSVEVHWIDQPDLHFNPMGAKGIGEIGIVGTAAAIANAVHHATGVRVRDLPITLDKLTSPAHV
jgi:xanthine dehydrogenase YagR molybdenum-binding subunit